LGPEDPKKVSKIAEKSNRMKYLKMFFHQETGQFTILSEERWKSYQLDEKINSQAFSFSKNMSK
jgi:hypothetical protein